MADIYWNDFAFAVKAALSMLAGKHSTIVICPPTKAGNVNNDWYNRCWNLN